MKTSIATTISISAVLVAGGVAFGVNSRALTTPATDNGALPAVQMSALAIEPADATFWSSSSTQNSSVVGNVAPAATAAPLDTPEAAQLDAPELSDYELAGIGVVTLQEVGENLTVFEVATSVGFTFSTTQIDSPQVRVDFLSSKQSVEFSARLIDGRIVTDVQAKAIVNHRESDNEHDESEHEENEDEESEHEDEHEGENDDD